MRLFRPSLSVVLLSSCVTPLPDRPDGDDTDVVVDTDRPDDTEPPVDTDEPVDTLQPPADAEVREAFGSDTVTVDVDRTDAARRTYTLYTTHPLRDGLPANGRQVVAEPAAGMTLRSGDLLLDALFALALQELRDASVSSISDGAFNNGGGVPCPCFETGERWNYVWTRDTAYAAHLGLPLVDPARTVASLRFKLSERKGGGDLQIVQDTGTGGSWPVSTDRVVWALGAREALAWMPQAGRAAFRDEALQAMANTIAVDRRSVFDAEDGLYRGEQSFLDWREQSYPSWTATDTVHIAMAKALSTNVGHLVLLRTAAELGAETSHPDVATWSAWASELEDAMRATFGSLGDGSWSSMTGTALHPVPLRRSDVLGTSLAVLEGVAGPDAPDLVARMPHTVMGPPVLWPQQPGVPVYHNRGIWPFVTSYALLAARHVGNDAVFDHDLESLVRGAALNLSHLEAFEFLTQANRYEDGLLSGPVVNSRRQLWSVAGFVGAIAKGVFGVEASAQGVRFAPFVTAGLRDGRLADADEIVLHDLTWRGTTFDVRVVLPPVGSASAGAFPVSQVQLDGVEAPGGWLTVGQLQGVQEVTVTLGTAASAPGTLRLVVDQGDPRDFFAPGEAGTPSLQAVQGGLEVTWAGVGVGVTYDLWRDGERVATALTTPRFIDLSATPETHAPCYTVEVVDDRSGHVSQPSRTTCWWGPMAGRLQEFGAHRLLQASGDGTWSTQHGRAHTMDWGDPGDTLVAYGVRPGWTGRHGLQLVYGNGAGGFTTGITAAHKRLVVVDDATDDVVAQGDVVMPHLGAWDRWSESSFLWAELSADTSYRVEVRDAQNMTYFRHFEAYTGGLGGGAAPYHRVNVAALKLLPVEGVPSDWADDPVVRFDGVDDLGDFAPGQVLDGGDLGATLEPWEAFALDWDEGHLYVTVVSRAFEEDFAPAMIYLEAIDGVAAQPVTSQGSPYNRGNVTAPASLPFRPSHQITLRAVTAGGPDGGPWNGVWAFDGVDYTLRMRLEADRSVFLAADRHTMSAAIPLSVLGSPRRVRLVAHVLWGNPGDEWKVLVPATHTPWQAGGGRLLEVDLTAADHGSTGWVLR